MVSEPTMDSFLDSSSMSVNINQCVTLKLSASNYLLWRTQFESFLSSQRLLGFVTGDTPRPATTQSVMIGDSISTEPNPDFDHWKRRDQLVRAWLFGSLSEVALRKVYGLHSAYEVWQSLSNHFNRVSHSRKNELQRRLQRIEKNGKSIADYLDSVKLICDQLDSIGFPVSEEDKMYAALNGLGKEYDSVSSMIEHSLESESNPNYEDLVGRLTNFEEKMQSHSSESDVSPHLAFTTTKNYEDNGYNSRGRSQGRGYGSYRGRGAYTTRGRGFPQQFNNRSDRGYNTDRGNNSETSSRLICQICEKYGHPATKCYKRFDQTFRDELHGAYTTLRVTDSSPNSGHEWFPDTGATTHLTNSSTNLSTSQSYGGNDAVMVGNGEFLPITHIGSTRLPSMQGTMVLKDVLVCPTINKSLISVSKLTTDYPCVFEFDSLGVVVKDKDTKQVLAQGSRHQDLYVLKDPQFQTFYSIRQQPASSDIWHLRLGHPNNDVLSHLANKNVIAVIKSTSSICNGCQLGKSSRLPFVSSEFVASRILQRIHCDLWGPAPVISSQGFRYYVIFVDNYSRYTWFYPLKKKSDFFETFANFLSMIETQFNEKVQMFQSDGGGEFVNKNVRLLLEKKGIQHLVSCPHTPQQNGLAERKHRHIMELGMSMMFTIKVPQYLWVEALFTSSFLINKLPSTVLSEKKSPHEVLFGSPPTYSFLRVFGCLCYPYLRPWSKNKFDPKSLPCVFLGYNEKYKGYRCLHPPSSTVYISRHVVFDENQFPFASTYLQCVKTMDTPLMNSWIQTLVSDIRIEDSEVVMPSSSPGPCIVETEGVVAETEQVLDQTEHAANSELTQNSVSPPLLSSHPMVTRSKVGVTKPNPKYTLLTVRAEHQEPKTVKSALKDPGWYAAMKEEMDTLQETCTWTLVEPNPNVSPVGSKWIFKTKIHADGSLDKLKARLVAKGYEQEEGVDYTETYSPVVRTATVRVVLHLAVINKWDIRQLDVKNAFLHGDLMEEVYMHQPSGFIDPEKPKHLCKLNKSIYGLKQSPRAWFDRFSSFLLQFGFKCSMSDPSLFVYLHQGASMYLLLYVDDMILTGSNKALVDGLLSSLQLEFRMKDLGQLQYFLGIQAHSHSTGLFLNQEKYASDLLVISGMEDCTSMPTPLPLYVDKVPGQNEAFPDPTYFRSLAGKLQYLTLTRPDLQYSVNLVCQRMHQPTKSDFTILKRILRYIKGTLSLGLNFEQHSNSLVRAYSDSDWAGCKETRRSTGGFCTFLGSNIISWSAKRHPTVSKSSTEAEYRTMSLAASELTWLASLLRELGVSQSSPAELYCDNLSSVHLSANPVMHNRSKHFDIDFHYIRERVALGSLIVQHIPTTLQLADIFTKSLTIQPFQDLRFNLGLAVPPEPSLRGRIEGRRETANVLLQQNKGKKVFTHKTVTDSVMKKASSNRFDSLRLLSTD